MNTVLTEVLLKACTSPVMLSDRFVLEHCMLLALLHCHLGAEVGMWVLLSVGLGVRSGYVGTAVCVSWGQKWVCGHCYLCDLGSDVGTAVCGTWGQMWVLLSV